MNQWVTKKVMRLPGEGLAEAIFNSNELGEFRRKLYPQGGNESWEIKIKMTDWKSYPTARMETSIAGEREGYLLIVFFDRSI